MTGTEFADILRDARMLSGGAPQYDWVRAWETARGIPLCTAAEEAALAAGRDGLLPAWLRSFAQAVCGRYTICAPEFARAADEAAHTLRGFGAAAFADAVHRARDAQTAASWCKEACVRALPDAREQVFLPWLCAMRARYVQE